jgi:hypothetical protein
MVNLVKNSYFHKWALKSGFQVIAFSSGLGYYVNGVALIDKKLLERFNP